VMLSQLITRLQAALDKQGDCKVEVYDGDGGFVEVSGIAQFEGEDCIAICDKETLEALR
jgi:hypothetical protein